MTHAGHSYKLWLILVTLSIIGFCQVVGSYFLSDDFVLIGRIAQDGYFTSWGQDTGGFLRPVTTASFLIDFHLWGFEPLGYHLVNILLHAAASILLLLVAKRLFALWEVQGGQRAAFAAATLFAVLPSHSEPVSWISGRGDLLATVMAMAATLAFLKSLSRVVGNKLRPSHHGSWLTGTVALIFLTGALLAKESTIVVPLIWLAILVAHRIANPSGNHGVAGLVLAGTIPLLSGYLLLRKTVLGHIVGGLGTASHLDILNLQTLENGVRYTARVMLPPLHLTDPRPLELAVSLLLILSFISLVGLLLRSVLKGMILRRTMSLVLLLTILFLISLLPVLSMMVSLSDTRSERFLYFPGVFACILTGLTLRLVFTSRRTFQVATVAVITISLICLLQSQRSWVDAGRLSESLSAQLAEYDPASVVVLNVPDNVGGAYLFRNGLSEAVTIFRGGSVGNGYRVLFIHSIPSPEEGVIAWRSGDSIRVILPPPVTDITWDEDHCVLSSLTASCRVDPDRIVLYYSSGQLHLLTD